MPMKTADISYPLTATTKGFSLEMNSACVAGNQHEIYEELDRQDPSASPSPITKQS